MWSSLIVMHTGKKIKCDILPKVLLSLLVMVFLSSCHFYVKNESKSRLESAAKIMDKNPEAALELLKQVSQKELGKDAYYYYTLLQARAQGLAGFDISFMEEPILASINYFTKKMDAAKLTLAYYMLAKIYEANNEPTKAVHYYLSADEWASEANYQISGFAYSHIPYNIAHHYKKNGIYTNSIEYLHKALKHAQGKEENYRIELYTLELLANNYNGLQNSDSAFFYYDKAQAIASQHSDTLSLNRIACNRIITLASTNDNKAEDHVIDLLAGYTDSVFICYAGLALAELYYENDCLDQADKCIYKAKRYLSNGVDDIIKLKLLDYLRLVEQQKNNNRLANSYLIQHSQLKKQLELNRLEMQAVMKQQGQVLLAESMKQQADNYQSIQNFKTTQKLLVGFLSVIVILAAIFSYKIYIRYKNRLRLASTQHQAFLWEVAKEDLQNNVSKRFMLSELKKDIKNMLGDGGQKSILLDKLDDIDYIEELPCTIKESYASCYSHFQTACPSLSSTQLSICSFLHLNLLTHGQLIRYLGISPQEYKDAVESINVKMQNVGLSFKIWLDDESS